MTNSASRSRFLFRGTTFLFVACLCGSAARADTIHLKNGYNLEGDIDTARSTKKEIFVQIGASGHVRLRRSDVVAVESGPATSGTEMVTVILHPDAYYSRGGRPRGGISGYPEKSNDEKTFVIRVPGVGRMRLPREMIKEIQPHKPSTAEPVTADTQSIPTTHLVHMKSGLEIRGTVLPGEDPGRVILEVGGLGRLYLNSKDIDRVEQSAGQYVLPPPAEAVEAVEPEIGELEEAREAGGAGPRPAVSDEPAAVPGTANDVGSDLEDLIVVLVNELARQRRQNRVRAENKLKALGAVVVPFLDSVHKHPFNLTRRAAMRIVRDAGDPAGLPLAIENLDDDDRWVRQHAHEALEALVGFDLGYDPRASRTTRRQAQERWIDYFVHRQIALARQ